MLRLLELIFLLIRALIIFSAPPVIVGMMIWLIFSQPLIAIGLLLVAILLVLLAIAGF